MWIRDHDHHDIIEHDGVSFAYWLIQDDDMTPPWDRGDGHGPVSDWTKRDKRPGELVLSVDGGHWRLYDYQEAMRIAKRGGWDAKPFGEGTKGQRAHRAVMADFDFLRRWCDDQWYYVGVVVAMINEDGEIMQEGGSVWGIESDADDHLEMIAHELAGEMLQSIRQAAGV